MSAGPGATRTAAPPAGGPPRWRERWRDGPVLLLGILVATVALLWVGWLTRPLFVFTETRPFSLTAHPIDVIRFFVAPVPAFGESRLLGIATFDLTGGICRVDAACTNGATAVFSAMAAVVVFLHTRQLARSGRLAAAVALLWIISGPVLVTSFWQSARFDILATIAILTTTAFWWRWLGRARVTPVRLVGFWIASCLLMAVAFNTKEVAYLLVPILAFLAVVRGMRIRAVRGDLILASVPLAYGVWFVAYALTHASEAYIGVTGQGDLVTGMGKLLGAMTGTSQGFAFVWQSGPAWESMRRLLLVALGVLGALLAAGAIAWSIAAARRAPLRTNLRLLRRWDREAYLVAMLAGTLIIGGRSVAAAGHYALITQWAALALGALLLRRLARLGRGWRAVAWAAGGSAAVVAVLACLTLTAPGSTYQQLVGASARIREVGATIEAQVAGRPVASVHWRTLETPPTAFYVLRAQASPSGVVGDDIWPWLVEDVTQRPPVEALLEGDLPAMRAAAATYDAPGTLLVVIDGDYGLRLLAYEGRLLLDAEATPPGG